MQLLRRIAPSDNGTAFHGPTNRLCGLCFAGLATASMARSTRESRSHPFASRRLILPELPATDGSVPWPAFCSDARPLLYYCKSSSDAAALGNPTRGTMRGEIGIGESPQENNVRRERSRPRDTLPPDRNLPRCAAKAARCLDTPRGVPTRLCCSFPASPCQRKLPSAIYQSAGQRAGSPLCPKRVS